MGSDEKDHQSDKEKKTRTGDERFIFNIKTTILNSTALIPSINATLQKLGYSVKMSVDASTANRDIQIFERNSDVITLIIYHEQQVNISLSGKENNVYEFIVNFAADLSLEIIENLLADCFNKDRLSNLYLTLHPVILKELRRELEKMKSCMVDEQRYRTS